MIKHLEYYRIQSQPKEIDINSLEDDRYQTYVMNSYMCM